MNDQIGEITACLHRANLGDPGACDRLYGLVEAELRRMANGQLGRERPGHSLQATVLIDDAFMRAVLRDTPFKNRIHFYRAAALAMRRILVDHERRRQAEKREGGWNRVPVELDRLPGSLRGENVVALDEALTRLAGLDAVAAEVVQLYHFGGWTQQEIAAMLDVHVNTVKRKWDMARGWLFGELTDGEDDTRQPNGRNA